MAEPVPVRRLTDEGGPAPAADRAAR